MLNLHVRAPLQRILRPVARFLVRLGVTPDMVTAVGTIGVVGGAIGFFPRGSLFVGTMVITGFVFSDMIDGAVARERGASGPWGAFFDSTMDRLGDAAIFASLTWWFLDRGDDKLLAVLCLFNLVTSFVISYARARAEGLGMQGNVGFYERSERLLTILWATGLSGLGVPFILAIALWALTAGTLITIGQRMLAVRRQATRIAAGATQGERS
jgi:CDP-diacylglycerol--glycerol-3-phosphate 3-phosphatidyltransferase